MGDIQFLYHYTSIPTLAYILRNRSIRFNNLLNVDDPEEAETEDLGKAGRHCLVSCWTDISEDLIPMWNIYTPDMKGVRIKMRQNPFKQYTYNKGELHFTQTTNSYIDYNSDYAKKVNIFDKCPLLVKVEYTENEKLLKPKVITKSENGVTVSFNDIGKYKRTSWAFQHEYRYKITTAPWSMEELEKVETPEEQLQIFMRLLDENNTQYCNEIFLNLADDAFEDMEILLAPKTTDAEYIIVDALLEKYCKGMNIKLEKSGILVR